MALGYTHTMVNLRSFRALIRTQRLCIRTLNYLDDLDLYLNWIRDSRNYFISSINPSYSMADLRAYVEDKDSSGNALLFGLFDISTNQHIGNLKFEPIVQEEKYAVMGILIGEADYRGIGIAKEAIINTFEQVLMNFGIERIILKVHRSNLRAISAYSKCGFTFSENPELNPSKMGFEMVLHAARIKK